MKRVSLVFLSVIFLFNSTGWQLVFFYLQNELHESNWAQNNENEFLIILESNAAISILNSHELSANGKLYDIVKTQSTGTGIKYLCKEDSKEDALLSSLADNLSCKGKDKNNSIKTSNLKSNFEFLLPDYVFFSQQEEILPKAFEKMSSFDDNVLKPPFFPPEV